MPIRSNAAAPSFQVAVNILRPPVSLTGPNRCEELEHLIEPALGPSRRAASPLMKSSRRVEAIHPIPYCSSQFLVGGFLRHWAALSRPLIENLALGFSV